jgi:hypothetical protein
MRNNKEQGAKLRLLLFTLLLAICSLFFDKRRYKMKRFLLTALFVLINSLAFAQERIAIFSFEDKDNLFINNDAFFFYRQFSNEFTKKNTGRLIIVPRQDVENLFSTEESSRFDVCHCSLMYGTFNSGCPCF